MNQLRDCNTCGEANCFDRLMDCYQPQKTSPVGETVKTLNICRIYHARVLAEHFETPPIYWNGCPCVEFKKS